MSYTESDLRQLRRLVSETSEDSDYSDIDLEDALERNDGNVYHAAAEICREKAAAATALFDFSADGGTYNRGQVAAKWLKLADGYQAIGGKKSGGTIRLVKYPPEKEVANVLYSGTDVDA